MEEHPTTVDIETETDARPIEATRRNATLQVRRKVKKPPTPRQRRALELLASGKVGSQQAALIAAGYSPATAKTPSRILGTPSFSTLLDALEEAPILGNIYRIAISEDDARNALSAADMILKLKDRYPQGKLRIDTFHHELRDLIEPTE